MKLSNLYTGLAVLALSSLAATCPPKPKPCAEQCLPGTHCVNGTCVPNTEPTPIPTPGFDNNRVLRTKGTTLTLLDGTPFNLNLGVQCCDAIQGIANSRWPLASVEVINYFQSFSLNAIAFRLGPFYGTPDFESEWADIGGPYTGNPGEVTLVFNSAFESKVLEIAHHAYDQKFWILVNIIDTWDCKHASKKQGFNDWQMPWPQADIDSCGISMTPVQEQYIRHWVDLLGPFPNVIFHADIEGSLLYGSSCSGWWYPQYQIIRDEESKKGFPVHLIGTNNEACAGGPFEFVSTHSSAGLLAPIAGKFTINDERGGDNTPDKEIGNFKRAYDLGLSYGYWRGEMSDSDSVTTLNGIKAVINGATPVVGCYAPDSEDPLWDPNPHARGDGTWTPDSGIRDQVNKARAELGPMTGQGHDVMLMAMSQKLRDYGQCASKASDAVMIKRTDNAPGQKPIKYEEYHVVNYSDDTWATNDKVLPKMLWFYNGDAPSGDCHGDVSTVDRVDCKMQQAYGLIDCTPKSHGQPIRPENDPERAACERKAMDPLGGYPAFHLDSATLILKTTSNPMQVIADKKGTGTLTCLFPKTGSQNFCNPPTGLTINKP